MRFKGVIAVLVAAVLASALPLRAQQPQQEPAPQSEPSGPERIFQGIGGAVRDLLRSIFGSDEREGEIPPPQQPAQPPPEQSRQQEAKPQEQANTAARAEVPVAATPSAQAAPQSLHSAIAKGEYGVALKMIEQGVDIEAKDPGAGASALHYAVMKGEMPLVGLLVQRGADVNSRTKSGTTPLHTAVLYRRTEIAEYLIDKGSEVNAKSASGATPLGLALAANYHTLERMLRARGGH